MRQPQAFTVPGSLSAAIRSVRSSLGLLALAAVLLSSGLLSSCGGVGVGGTGTYGSGPITGFGSIWVAGVRFIDTTAEVIDEDGQQLMVSDLKLGATVTVVGDTLVTDGAGVASAKATRITLGSAIVGPVQGVDAAAGVLQVLGQAVRVRPDTVFDEALADGLSSVLAGQVVRVYGLHDASRGGYQATRIEPASGAAVWRLRGPVLSVDAAASKLTMGNATIRYEAATGVPADLTERVASGRAVRLRIAAATDPDRAGELVAVSFAEADQPLDDVQEARVGGLVSDFGDFATTRRFSIGGVPVDATNAEIQGETRLKLGADATARGPVRGGVIQATLVIAPAEPQTSARFFEAPFVSADVDAQTLVLQTPDGEVEVWFGRPVPDELSVLPAGSTLARLSTLAPGAMLRVRAVPANGRLEATIVNFLE